MIMKDLQELIDNGYKVVIYENALGGITAEAHSSPSSIILEEQTDEFSEDIVKSVQKLVRDTVADGLTLQQAIFYLNEKVNK